MPEISSSHPIAAIGVIIPKDGKVLVMKRRGGHAPKFSIPGGHLELGETFEEAAVREIKEETGLDIRESRVVSVTNNLETYREEGRHYVSVILVADDFFGEPRIMEPEKCETLLWCDPKELPEPHFDASRRGVECWLQGAFYKKYEK